MESRQALIARLQDRVHQCLAPYVKPDEPFALLDFPNIKNVGDSAIWLGEIAYFKARFGTGPSYVSTLRDFSADALDAAVPAGPIFIHGGGNFGDVWGGHQDFREQVMERWPGRLVVQLPQSIHYSSTDRAEVTARAIARHGNFKLLVRDEESLEFSRKHFQCDVRLCPDMAFCIGQVVPGTPRFPVLAMLRNDVERAFNHDLTPYPEIPVEDWITESRLRIRLFKAIGLARGAAMLRRHSPRIGKFDAAAKARFRRGVRQLSRGQAIITDRLHVHIVSLLLGRPHAVFDNSYGKVRRFMAAFSGGTELSHLAMSTADAVEWARAQAGRA